ncbi:MAG: BlaI/MecI/CopY family transcriptional regulator [Bacteroidetes bacterium]|nr:MAG: BlaI/MecI/CopY family transcriptional regulator [Bacteroidota bacterium]
MIKPTESELEVLQILWETGGSTVRFVNDKLNEHREVGYTTTLKIMQLMHEKGLLNRDDSERSHLYTAQYSREVAQKTFLDRLTETVFGGSAMRLVMQALGNRKTSTSELDEIKKLIEQIEKEKGGNQ